LSALAAVRRRDPGRESNGANDCFLKRSVRRGDVCALADSSHAQSETVGRHSLPSRGSAKGTPVNIGHVGEVPSRDIPVTIDRRIMRDTARR